MLLHKYTSEFRQNLKIATPVMLGSLGHLLVGLVDDIMVGQLSPIHLAATSLGNSFFFIAFSIGLGFSFAITPLIAESDGENNINKGRSYFQHGVILTTILGVVMFIALLLLKPILYHLDQPEEVVALAIPYYEIVAFSMIPVMVFQGFKQFADGLAQTRYPMYATIATNVVNIVLNFVLIYGFWIFPRLEIVGAAIGTLVSRFVLVFMLYYFFNKNDVFKPFLVRIKKAHLDFQVFKKIINIGFPSALQMLFEIGIFSATVILAGTLGAFPQAANQIAIKLATATFMIASGLSVAATIRVGNQKGMGNYIELRRIAFSNFLLVFLIMFGFSIAFLLFKNYLPYIFTDNLEVVAIASQLLIIAALFQISDGFQVIFLGALRGLQDLKIPSYLTFIAYWIIGFPVSYILGIFLNFGAVGIWIGLLAGLSSSAIMLFIRFNYLSKKLIKTNHYEHT
ncbi:MAG: MATE family efflux transporter [Flavobacteriaceae bacterium]|nr:MATE family efflux transporter [Flavobacteriaceae bacterium]